MANDPGNFDLREVFLRMREQMLAELSVGGLLRHATAIGNASERVWLNLFERFLPGRYRAGPAFVVDSTGNRSRQLDIVISDALQGPSLFPHTSGLHIPIECVYAVLEVKSTMRRREWGDAGMKAASVRALCSQRPRPIVAGVVALTYGRTDHEFEGQILQALELLGPEERLEIGCLLRDGAFEGRARSFRVSSPEESLAFFMIRLSERLRALPRAQAVDLRCYSKGIESLR